jgi:hypothetical protein
MVSLLSKSAVVDAHFLYFCDAVKKSGNRTAAVANRPEKAPVCLATGNT